MAIRIRNLNNDEHQCKMHHMLGLLTSPGLRWTLVQSRAISLSMIKANTYCGTNRSRVA